MINQNDIKMVATKAIEKIPDLELGLMLSDERKRESFSLAITLFSRKIAEELEHERA